MRYALITCGIVIFALLASPPSRFRQPAGESLQNLTEFKAEIQSQTEWKGQLASPLILGASVSAGLGTGEENPVAQILDLAGIPNDQRHIQTFAANGATSARALTVLENNKITSRWIAALDVLYWDTVVNRLNCDSVLENARRLLEKLKSMDIPYAFATVPKMNPKIGKWKIPFASTLLQSEDCLDDLNQTITDTCAQDPRNCVLVDLYGFSVAHRSGKFADFFRERGLSYHDTGESLTMGDGLHLNSYGARVIAVITLLELRKLFQLRAQAKESN